MPEKTTPPKADPRENRADTESGPEPKPPSGDAMDLEARQMAGRVGRRLEGHENQFQSFREAIVELQNAVQMLSKVQYYIAREAGVDFSGFDPEGEGIHQTVSMDEDQTLPTAGQSPMFEEIPDNSAYQYTNDPDDNSEGVSFEGVDE